MKQWKNLLPEAYVCNVQNCSWEMLFFESKEARIQKFSKLVEISCLQVMKSKLTIIPYLLDMHCSNMSVVCTYHFRGV